MSHILKCFIGGQWRKVARSRYTEPALVLSVNVNMRIGEAVQKRLILIILTLTLGEARALVLLLERKTLIHEVRVKVLTATVNVIAPTTDS